MSGPSTQAPKLQPKGEEEPRKVADVVNTHAEMINTGQLQPYTVATLPDATLQAGMTAYCSDETGGAVIVFSDGTNWRRSTDRAVAS